MEKLQKVLDMILETVKFEPWTKRGSCMSWAQKVNDLMMKKRDDYWVVEGWVTFESDNFANPEDVPEFTHTWIVFEDGRILDRTLVQWANQWDLSTVKYIERKDRFTPLEYQNLCNTENLEESLVMDYKTVSGPDAIYKNPTMGEMREIAKTVRNLNKNDSQAMDFKGLYDPKTDDIYIWANERTYHDVAYAMIGRQTRKSLSAKIHLSFNIPHSEISVYPDEYIEAVQNSPRINKYFPQFTNIKSTNG